MMTIGIQKWNLDIQNLQKLNVDWNDKLSISRGQLQFTCGKRHKCNGESTLSNAPSVTKYLESLVTQTAKECFQSLKESCQDKNRPEIYEQVSDFKKQVKILKEKFQLLSYTFLPHGCNNASYEKKYSQLSEQAGNLLKQVKDFQSTLKKPSQEERPILHLEGYNERTANWFLWRVCFSNRFPTEEIEKAAKQALAYAHRAQKKTEISTKKLTLKILFSPLIAISGILSALKIFLWNPMERLICGEVKTLSPLTLAYIKLADWGLDLELNRHPPIDHLYIYERLTNSLLHQPKFLPEKNLKAFENLVSDLPHLDLQDLYWVSENPLEFVSLMEEDKRAGAIPVKKYLEHIENHYDKKLGFISLLRLQVLYTRANDEYLRQKKQSVDAFLKIFLKNRFKRPATSLWGITPSQFKKIMKLVSDSPKCRKITLSPSFTEQPFVRDLLNQHNYKLTTDGKYKKTYCRSI